MLTALGLQKSIEKYRISLLKRLFQAIKDNDLPWLEKLIEAGAEIENIRWHGCNALHEAARLGRVGMVQRLLKAEMDPTAPDLNQYTALHWAVRYDHFIVTQEFIQILGEDVNPKAAGDLTPLHWAARFNQAKAALILVHARGIDLEPGDFNGNTPLMLAAEHNHHEVAQILIDADADVNAPNFFGETPLFLAAYNGHLAMVKRLVGAGANIETKDKLGRNALQIAIEREHSVIAREEEYFEIVEYLKRFFPMSSTQNNLARNSF